jgi:muconate cycloisomerase
MLNLVASTPNYSLANDCTYYGLEDDVLTNPFKIERGHLLVPQGPGLGIDIDVEKVHKYQV